MMPRVFDARSRLVYLILAIGLISVVAVFQLTQFSFQGFYPASVIAVCVLVPAGILCQRYLIPQLGLALEMFGLLAIVSIVAQLGTILLSAASLPYQDSALAHVDASLGFSWLAILDAEIDNPLVAAAAPYFYTSLNWQPFAVIGTLVLSHRSDRAWTFVTAWFVTLALVTLIYPLVPARGAFVHYHVAPDRLPGTISTLAYNFPPIIDGLKSGAIRIVTPDAFVGLVSFPSFHAGGATLFTWAMWQTRARWVFVGLNAALTASALVAGSHYLIDLIGGIAVALLSIGIARAAVQAGARSTRTQAGSCGDGVVCADSP